MNLIIRIFIYYVVYLLFDCQEVTLCVKYVVHDTMFTTQCFSWDFIFSVFSLQSEFFYFIFFLFLFCLLEKLFMIILFFVLILLYFNFTTKHIVVSSHSLFNRQTTKIIIIINKLQNLFFISIVLFAHSLVMFVMICLRCPFIQDITLCYCWKLLLSLFSLGHNNGI